MWGTLKIQFQVTTIIIATYTYVSLLCFHKLKSLTVDFFKRFLFKNYCVTVLSSIEISLGFTSQSIIVTVQNTLKWVLFSANEATITSETIPH